MTPLKMAEPLLEPTVRVVKLATTFLTVPLPLRPSMATAVASNRKIAPAPTSTLTDEGTAVVAAPLPIWRVVPLPMMLMLPANVLAGLAPGPKLVRTPGAPLAEVTLMATGALDVIV